MAYPAPKGNEVAFLLVQPLQLGSLPIYRQDQMLTRMIGHGCFAGDFLLPISVAQASNARVETIVSVSWEGIPIARLNGFQSTSSRHHINLLAEQSLHTRAKFLTTYSVALIFKRWVGSRKQWRHGSINLPVGAESRRKFVMSGSWWP